MEGSYKKGKQLINYVFHESDALGAHTDVSLPCFQVQETIMNLHRTIGKMYQTNTSRYYHFKKKQALLTEARK